MKSKKIAVVMGGPSSERAVSLETGAGVLAALCGLGYDAVAIDWKPGVSIARQLEDESIDLVWNALHGTCGEDGAIQGLLQCMDIPCTGAGLLSSAMAMDKIASKRVFESIGIPTPAYQIWEPGTEVNIPLPVVVKPANEGSSVGVSLVFKEEELLEALECADKFHGPVLIEEYISGLEVFVGILDDEALGTIEVKTARGFYDYEAKYESDDTEYLVPAPLAPELIAGLEELGLAAHRGLGCKSYSRVDIRVSESGEAFVLEVNTLPGMTSHSLMPKLAAHAGISYPELCERILRKTLVSG